MLNRAKVLAELQALSDSLFIDMSDELELLQKTWIEISQDPLFKIKVAQASSPWLMPTWSEPLSKVYSVQPKVSSYEVVAVDGSQIYPDKHQGTACYLINTGSVVLRYGLSQGPAVILASEPFVYAPDQEDELLGGAELVNCRRQELEFKGAIKTLQAIKGQAKEQTDLFFVDGSLIFWHLEGKAESVKQEFVTAYLQALDWLYRERQLVAGFISMPKSKELVNLVRMRLSEFSPATNDAHKQVMHAVDSHIASFLLQPYERTIVFASQSAIVDYYPDPLKPYFYYLHVGAEIVRIEIPKWIALDRDALDKISSIAIDQSLKGGGYPVCLAESHEQAVVKGPDREFFYHCIQKVGIEQHKRMLISQKSLKKRIVSI